MEIASIMVAPGLLQRLRAGQLTGALEQISAYLLAEPAEAMRLTISELAERTGTSAGTVTRFCHQVGLPGFAGLKVALAEEVGRAAPSRWTTDIGRSIQPGDDLDQVLKVIVAASTQAVFETADQLDLAEIDRVAHALTDARNIYLFGVGTSAISADELRIRLQRIGFSCWLCTDVHSALISIALAGERDLVFGISQSGQVTETIDVLQAAASRSVRTVAVTNDHASTLAAAADLVLTTARTGTAQADAPADRHSQLLVLDVLYARIAQLTHVRTVAALKTTAAMIDPRRTPKPGRRRAPAQPKEPS
ncbi:MurR/RpiR family transcriptional regulator [Kribbella sp. NPDC005582]|uniref:MurR/RpiR family transcriptional regulator n=1 Tax=Kribbella sp. NPDC005582 TaxID=3156893 RepID=UPI0033B630AD